MNVIAALLAPKIQNALILSVNISANAMQDWIFEKLKSCIESEISRKSTFYPMSGLIMKEQSCIDIDECNRNETNPCDLNAKEFSQLDFLFTTQSKVILLFDQGKEIQRNFQSAKILLEVMNVHAMALYGLDLGMIAIITIRAFRILVRRSVQFAKSISRQKTPLNAFASCLV